MMLSLPTYGHCHDLAQRLCGKDSLQLPVIEPAGASTFSERLERLNAMNVYDILSAWPVESPLSAEVIPGGNNNLSIAVVTADTQYILRVYQNNGEPNRIRYEHALLTRLEQANLPFSVPAPIPALSGSTLLPVQDDPGQTFAALFQFIPGEHPSADNLAHHRLCGAVLARLDQALGQVTLDAQSARPSFADISRIHPAVPDPLVWSIYRSSHRSVRRSYAL